MALARRVSQTRRHAFLDNHASSENVELIHEWHVLVFSRLSDFRIGGRVLDQRREDGYESGLHGWR